MTVEMPWWVQFTIPIGAFYTVLLGTLSLAFLRGGAPEKRGCMVFIAMAAWQYPANFVFPPRFLAPDVVSVISDAIALMGFGAIAINANRIWPIWASALQLLSISAHFARAVELSFPPLVYAWMKSAPTAAAILALLVGTLLHMRRKAKYGKDPCWQDWQRIEEKSSILRQLKSSPR